MYSRGDGIVVCFARNSLWQVADLFSTHEFDICWNIVTFGDFIVSSLIMKVFKQLRQEWVICLAVLPELVCEIKSYLF
jgi:hypothetical protein